ncbi:MAG: hypothetical protein Q8M16_14005 [Pirellulaceae bacterium]|nr:hypothetical protein [Pirellulaceae bacterium]
MCVQLPAAASRHLPPPDHIIGNLGLGKLEARGVPRRRIAFQNACRTQAATERFSCFAIDPELVVADYQVAILIGKLNPTRGWIPISE